MITKQIKALNTSYKGHVFRSRLEARWAVFFDAVDTRWEYEPEGYDLGRGHGGYVPDFFLPDVLGGLWVEAKPDREYMSGAGKLEALTKLTGQSGIVVKGDPYTVAHSIETLPPGADDASAYWLCQDGDAVDGPYLPCVCPWCGKFSFQFDGRGARVCGGELGPECRGDLTWADAVALVADLGHWHADKCYTSKHTLILEAAAAARRKRFT